MGNLAMLKEYAMFEQILDKIDEWSNRLYDWQRTSASRGAIVFCLNVMLVIPFAFAVMGVVGGILLFIWWVGRAWLGA